MQQDHVGNHVVLVIAIPVMHFAVVGHLKA